MWKCLPRIISISGDGFNILALMPQQERKDKEWNDRSSQHLTELADREHSLTYLRAYRNIRHNEIFTECGKCLREEATTQKNLDYHLVSLTKYFVLRYISVCPQVRYKHIWSGLDPQQELCILESISIDCRRGSPFPQYLSTFIFMLFAFFICFSFSQILYSV